MQRCSGEKEVDLDFSQQSVSLPDKKRLTTRNCRPYHERNNNRLVIDKVGD